jgi:hypothetical protein
MLMSRFLRTVLLADAVATMATGVVMAVGSTALEPWLNIPAPLLFYAGLVLLPYAAFVFYLTRQSEVPRSAVWAVVLCNAAWAIDSLLLLTTGWIAPSPLGYAFVIVQAVVVAVFCELQWLAMRRVTVQTWGLKPDA